MKKLGVIAIVVAHLPIDLIVARLYSAGSSCCAYVIRSMSSQVTSTGQLDISKVYFMIFVIV